MKRVSKIIVRVIGMFAILCGAFGLYYNGSSLAVALSGAFTAGEQHHETPYFYPAFYIMSAICIACFLSLTVFGIQFMRVRVAHLRGFTILLIFEVIHFFSIGMFWLLPGVGMSIGAATGVANGGLMAQFLILFPIWAPPLAFWSRKNLLACDENAEQSVAPKA